jgi:octaprenyl-diphosphate synthase
VALINQISHYIINAPAASASARCLVLLLAQALGFMGPERFELAATVEFIHTATLLHDDVVDESSLRRGRRRPTPCSATPPACWWATSCTRAPSR